MNYYGNCNNRNCCPSGETGTYVTTQGPAGPKGERGEKGDKGDVGEKGD